MKRLLVKILLIMFPLTQKSRKILDSDSTVDVKSVMKSIQALISAKHANAEIQEIGKGGYATIFRAN